jgi:glycine/D-amino acid oxidase-like deaminating enzyme
MLPVTPVSSSPAFPHRVDVVVIGAGIIGVSAAIELQARGLSVVLVEKGEVAAEQSSRNWGWCRQMGRDPRELPLIKHAMALWRGMNQRIGTETGFRSCGVVYLSETDAELAHHVDWHGRYARDHDLKTRLLSREETLALVPGGTTGWRGALYTEDDGRAEPFIAVPAMAEFFKQRGGTLLTGCAARGLETQAGRVSSVVTERGAIATGAVVLAGGYWSRRFLGNLDVHLPQTGVISSVLRTSPVDLGHGRTFAGNRFAVRKRLDGGYTVAHNLYAVADLTPGHLSQAVDFMPLLKMNFRDVKLRLGRRFIDEWRLARHWGLDQVSPFERVRVLDPKPYTHLLDDALYALQRAYPAFQGVAVAARWAGMIDATPDAVPVIDRVEQVPGLFVATGFSGHGFGLGPGAGQLMAEIVTGQTPCVDPQPFRLARFRDGRRPKPVAGL